MNYKESRTKINHHLDNNYAAKNFLMNHIGIDVTKDNFFKVRPDERTPSCKINKDGSFHDFGSGEHFSDLVALLYDGYHAFDSLPETMEWVCQELGIDWEVNDE